MRATPWWFLQRRKHGAAALTGPSNGFPVAYGFYINYFTVRFCGFGESGSSTGERGALTRRIVEMNISAAAFAVPFSRPSWKNSRIQRINHRTKLLRSTQRRVSLRFNRVP